MTFAELQKRINQNAPVDFGDVFSNAFNLFQKIWVEGFVMQLIVFGVIIGVMFVLYIPMLAGVLIVDTATFETNSELPGIIFLIGVFFFYLFFIMAMIFFSTGLQAAFYRQIRMKDRGMESERGVSWGMFFKKKYFAKLLLHSLATLGIVVASCLLCFLPVLYAIVPLQFISVVFAFNPELSVKELITTSFTIGTKKWGITFGLTIMCSLLAQTVGFMMCGIGILFTASFVYLPVYFIYKEVIGFYEDDATIARIGA